MNLFQNVIHSYNEIPLNNKKEWRANVCCSIHESQNHFAKERSRTQRQRTTPFHLLESPRKNKTTETENRSVVSWVRECKWGLTENGSPLQYSCLENSTDRGAWWASVHGVTRVRHDWVTKPTVNSSKWWCEHLPTRASTNTITLRQKTKGKEIWTELLVLLSHFSCVRLCATPSLGFSRQEHWSGSPFPSPMHAEKWKVKVKSLSRVRLFMTPWTAAHQGPLSMGFSRQEQWSGLPLPSPLDWANIT